MIFPEMLILAAAKGALNVQLNRTSADQYWPSVVQLASELSPSSVFKPWLAHDSARFKDNSNTVHSASLAIHKGLTLFVREYKR